MKPLLPIASARLKIVSRTGLCTTGVPDTAWISQMVARHFPSLRVADMTHDASHGEVYYQLLRNLDTDCNISTVVVTMNLRSFGVGWIYSPLETALQKRLVMLHQRPPLVNRAVLSFKAYDIKGFASYRAQLAKFGFFDTIHTQMGDLMPVTIRNDGRFDNYYAVCFGAGFHIPVLRTLMYYNAIANDGKMMKPLFVKYITNDYDTIERFEPEVVMEKMVSDRTLRLARAYLDSVVWGRYGTGRRYKDPTCPFAGKTGTRDLWDEKTKSWIYDRNAVSFCGYFPKDKPKYTMIIYIYDVPQHSEVAVDVFGKIARSIMNSNNFSAMHNIEEYNVQPLVLKAPVNRRLLNPLFASMGFDTLRMENVGQFMTAQTDDSLRCVLTRPLELTVSNGVPDVRGMIASDAVAVLMRAGYRPAVKGRGVVTRYEVTSGKTVQLYLEPVR